MGDLRSRRHQQTKRALVDAALHLFAKHGYPVVTMATIADVAGVSRSTAYRRFESKDDILLETPRQWLAIWDERRAELAGEPPLEVLAECARAVAAHVDTNRDEIMLAIQALAGAPHLAASSAATDAWSRRLFDLVAADPAAAGLSEVERRIVAGAYKGGIDAVLDYWVAGTGATSIADGIEEMLTRLAPVWPSS